MAIRMSGGLTATIVSGRFGWTSHPQNGPQRIILIGTEGSLTFDAYRPRVEIYNDDPDHTHPPLHLGDPMAMWGSTAVENPPVPKKRWASFDQSDAMVTDVAAFIDCIETGTQARDRPARRRRVHRGHPRRATPPPREKKESLCLCPGDDATIGKRR